MSTSLWKIENATLGTGPSPRLHNISLDVKPGVTAVLGASGAGKSSLLNLLVGYETATTGSVTNRVDAHADSPEVFWVPQDYGVWPFMSVEEHLQDAAPASSGAAIDDLLDAFDLTPLRTAKPPRLSHGERARLAVARALITGAPLLVMDEPLSNVDPEQTSRYWDVLRSCLQRNNSSLVFATHSPRVVLREADHVVCLAAGHITFTGTVDALYWDPPTPALAQVLGEANWLTADEQQRWLHKNADAPRCFRPEQLLIDAADDGALAVHESRVYGPVSEVMLTNGADDDARRFFCNAATGPLAPGQRVVLRVLMLCLTALLAVGCTGSNVPALALISQSTWRLPVSGRSVPAPRSVGTGPNGVAVLDDAGRVVIFDRSGQVQQKWNMPENDVGNPEGVCILRSGNIAVCDTHYSRVIIFARDGTERLRIGGHGRGQGEFIYPVAIAEDPGGNLYVGEYGSNDRIQKFSGAGEFIMQFGGFGTAPGEFQRPSGIVWVDGKVYVSDAFNNRIQVFTETGEFIEILSAGDAPLQLHFPYDIAVAPDQSFYIIEYGTSRITHITQAGQVLSRHGGPGMGMNQFKTPWGIGVDDRGRIFVADTGNRRLVELVPES